jgi:hypothetical protein
LVDRAESASALGQLRTLTTTLASRFGLAGLAGLTFGGARDLYTALGYKTELTPRDYRARYKRNSLAKRVVEAAPKDTWRAGGELIEDDDPDTVTAFEAAWNALALRLQIWSVFARADILAGLGQYSIILIGAPGDFKDPLPPRLRPEAIAYLTPFSEEDASIGDLVTDTQNPRFGQPANYKISRIGGTLFGRSTLVDASRVLHIADGLLSDKVYGQPRLEGVWNDFDNLEKVVGGGSEAYWLRVHQGMHFDLDKDVTVDPAQKDALKEATDDFANGFKRSLATRGMKVEMFGSDVSPFAAQVDSIITLIAGGSGIPKRILVGTERGELASTQDRTNWNDRITDRRNDFAGPQVVRPFVDLLIRVGALPKPTKYEIRWPEIQFLNETEQAAVAVQWSSLNSRGTVVTADEIRDRILGLPPLATVQPVEPAAVPDEVPPAPGTPAASQLAAGRRKSDPRVRDAVHAAVAASHSAIDETRLAAALASGNTAELDAILREATAAAEQALAAQLPGAALDAIVAGGGEA